MTAANDELKNALVRYERVLWAWSARRIDVTDDDLRSAKDTLREAYHLCAAHGLDSSSTGLMAVVRDIVAEEVPRA